MDVNRENVPDKLELLREPFKENQISQLPKPTKAQTDAVKRDFKEGVRCKVCGGWHHPKVIHLDYVGHAALTDRLLSVDINWTWEPLSFDDNGLPLLDKDGGLWIKLTVCGLTRLGYGDSGTKKGADAIKEKIGDALRNAAMRFGAALDLWHKGDLNQGEEEEQEPKKEDPAFRKWMDYIDSFTDKDLTMFESAWEQHVKPILGGVTDSQRKEMIIAKNEMTTHLGEDK